MSKELDAAMAELDAAVTPAQAEQKEVIEKSVTEKLADMSTNLLGLVNRLVPGRADRLAKAKAYEGKETDEEEEMEEKQRKKANTASDKMDDEARKSESVSGQDTLSKSLADSQAYQEVVEASQAMVDLEIGITKSLGQVESNMGARFTRLEKSLADIAGAMALMCTAQASIKKSFDGQPKSQPMFGYLGAIEKGNGAQQQNGTPNRDDISLKLQQMVSDGKALPAILSKFDTQPQVALSMIGSDLKKSYGIPDTL